MYNILPFYTDIDQQNWRKSYCHGDVCLWKLITNNDRLPPFQIQRPTSAAAVTELQIICYNDTTGVDILPDIDPADITIENAGGVDWITYFAREEIDPVLECGTYYLKLTDADGKIWYSELFTIDEFTDDTIDVFIKVYDIEYPVITIDGTDDILVN